MTPLLEVIAQTVEDAIEAEAGGADRIELVRSLELGGLTPPDSLVESVLDAVSVPVRVMLREQPTMSLRDDTERHRLLAQAAHFARLPVDGIVAGFLRGKVMDVEMMLDLADRLKGKPITFHRAFDEVEDAAEARHLLRQIQSVDRVLTAGQGTTIADRVASVLAWQGESDSPTFLFAPGLENLPAACGLREVHVGRPARLPAEHYGRVDRVQVRKLRLQICGL